MLLLEQQDSINVFLHCFDLASIHILTSFHVSQFEMIALVAARMTQYHSSHVFKILPIVNLTGTFCVMQGNAFPRITRIESFGQGTTANRTRIHANNKLHEPIQLLNFARHRTLATNNSPLGCFSLHAYRISYANKYLKLICYACIQAIMLVGLWPRILVRQKLHRQRLDYRNLS